MSIEDDVVELRNKINISMTENRLTASIKEAELEKKAARSQRQFHRQEATRYESLEIEASIQIDRFKEELARHHSMYPKVEEELRDRDIRELAERLPELLKKIL